MNPKDLNKGEYCSYIVKLGNFFVVNHKYENKEVKFLKLNSDPYYANEFNILKDAISLSEKIKGKVIKRVEVIEKSYKYEEVLFF